MTAVLAPFGARPIYHPSGQTRPRNFQNSIPSAYGTNIYFGAPVALSNGAIVLAAASGADFIGFFAGVQYPDASGKPTFSPNWVAGTVLGVGSDGTSPLGPEDVFVWDQPDNVYSFQVNGTAAETDIGDQANFSAVVGYRVQDGFALTGYSTCALDPTFAGSGTQGMVRIIDLLRQPDNAWSDAFTIVQVQVARHQYVSDKVAI